MRVISLKLLTGEVVLLKDEKLTQLFLNQFGKYVTQGSWTKVAKNPKQVSSLLAHVKGNIDKFKAAYKQQTGKDLDEVMKEQEEKAAEEAKLEEAKQVAQLNATVDAEIKNGPTTGRIIHVENPITEVEKENK